MDVDVELPRPRPRPSSAERLRAVVAWIGPGRLVGGAVTAVCVGVGGWWLLHAPAPPVERSLPRAAATTTVAPAVGVSATGGQSTAVVDTATTRVPDVVVHVAGAVRRPGLVRLQAGDRVADALAAAGGSLDDADLDVVNLAAPVIDGSRLYVPRHGEPVPSVVAGGGGGPGSGAPTMSSAPGPLDLNTATAAQLEELPGVGPATSAAIVSHREANGPFRTVDDLLDVRGIGPGKLAQFRDLVTV